MLKKDFIRKDLGTSNVNEPQRTTWTDQNEQIGKTRVGRRTNSDQKHVRVELSGMTNIRTLKPEIETTVEKWMTENSSQRL